MAETAAKPSTDQEPHLREHIRESWADLTEPEIDWVGDEPERLASALSQKYGISRDEAARQVWHFMEELPGQQSEQGALNRPTPMQGDAE
mgnify:CR=1 FL=1